MCTNSFGVRVVLVLILIIGMLGVERTQGVLAATITVTNTNDSGVGSLRQAIINAISGDTITFGASLAGQTITLATDLLINKDLTINGSGLASQITVNGGNVAHLVIQNSTLPPTVTISDITIINGYTTNNGGAISVGGDLTLINSTLRNNYAVGSGGAISSSKLTLKNTTLTQNQAGSSGGAISLSGNTISTIINSTITQNQAGTGGGMTIIGNPIVDVLNSTFADNMASSGSELMLTGNGVLQLSNTILVCKPGEIGCIIQNGNFSVASTNSMIGTGTLYDFGLTELADNGGPTRTMALLPESLLVDAGDDSICANSYVNNLDQRGMTRPYGSHCDIGAYELSYLTVSGNTGIGGAIMKYGYGLFTVADNNGNYSIKVLPGWSGTVVPSKLGHSFTPVKKVYTNIQSNQTSQNYSATANTYIYPGNSGDTWRVSVPNGGGQSDNNSYNPSISADGRYVAYWSFASNLVAGDGANDIVVYDNQTGQTSAVSVDSNGTPLNCNSYAPSISADGRYVSFSSCAGGLWVVYVYDRQTGILDSAGRGEVSSISADGRYVAYHSTDNPTFQFRIFVEDMLTRTGKQISISTTGGQPDGDSVLPSISANGRYVAFHSSATNLINSDTNGVEDVFVYDLQTDEVTRVSVNSSGAQANGGSFVPSISADGRYVAFHSLASNLVSNDTNGAEDVFVHDLQTGETTRVSIDSNGAQGNLASNQAHIFGNGRYVAFRSLATDLILGDTNGAADIFVYDRQTGQTTRVSVGSNGVQANGDSPSSYSQGFSITEDGKYLAFSSHATNLVNSDTNEYSDIFVHETSNLTSTFADVPNIYWARDFVERLYAAGITSGCGVNPLRYCPEGVVTRGQMAVFLERGIHGSSYLPPSVGSSTGFNDVSTSYWSAAWIKQLVVEGITAGCGNGNYCPEGAVTRAQMAVFLLRSKYGSSYTPPALGGSTGFGDVSPSYWAAAWIKQLVTEGITAGCGNGNYCPESPVTRAQMAVFLVRTFNVP